MLILALHDLRRLLRVADITAALSVEALLGTDRVFAEDLIALRPHDGQAASAANLRRVLAGSPIVASHRYNDDRVQDAYSLRCAPQVNGAARDTVAHAERVAAAELASAIDNPMVLPDGRVESCGNFHGAPLGFALDFLAIAVAEVGGIAERRTDRLLDAARSHGLPPFLTTEAGVNSGLMLAQYTQASLVSENRRLAAPGEHRVAADERDAGGSRLDGLVGRTQAPHRARQPRARARGRADLRGARARPAGAAAARPRRRGGAGGGALAHRRARARTATSRPTSRRPRSWSRAARCWRRSRPRWGRWHERSRGARPAGAGAVLQGLAAGGRAADAHEQPRPGRRRAPRRPRRLRRHRPRGALVGGVRRDRARAARARGRRDAARPVGQAGRRHADARVGAARADRQLQPRAGVGDVGGVPPARGSRADDVRADDRGVVDLHRHPGDRAGHLRVLRGDRAAPLRRLAGRDDHADRGARRDGRRAAAGGDHERRGRALHRDRRAPHPAADRDALPRRAGRRLRRRRRALPGGEGGAPRAVGRVARQRRRAAAARC